MLDRCVPLAGPAHRVPTCGRRAPKRRLALAATTVLLGALAAGAAHAAEALDEARALTEEGRLEPALDRYTAWLERHPDDRDARLERARVLGWLGRHEDAHAELSTLLERHPDDREARVARARLLGWMGRHDEAAAEAERVLAADPRNVDALLVLGDLRAWQGDLDAAALAYERARALAPGDARIWLRVGRLHHWRGRPGAAREAWETGQRLAPDDPEIREALRGLETGSGADWPRWRVDAGLRYDHPSGPRSDWWHEHLQVAYRPRPALNLHTGVEQYRRFGEDDTVWTLGAVARLPGRWWIDAHLAFGFDAQVVARQVYQVEISRELGERWTARARYRRSAYVDDVDVDAFSPALEVAPDPRLRLRARYHLTHVSGGRFGHAGALHVDLLPGARASPFLAGALGSEAFAPSSVGADRSNARVASASAGVLLRVGERAGVRLALAWEDLDDTYERWGMVTAFHVSF